MQRPIGVFDSGIGGLNVLCACASVLPNENFIYLADEANMPYGTKPHREIVRAAVSCAETLVGMNCKAIVVACNTATENAVSDIRRLFKTLPVVGLEPAVKPCFKELSSGGYAVVLVTQATARSARFNRLIDECDGRILTSPQPRLASVIEESIDDEDALRKTVNGMLLPYSDAEAIVLGCSHYSVLTKYINEFYGGRIKIYDGAVGAAARLKYMLDIYGLRTQNTARGTVRFYSTERTK